MSRISLLLHESKTELRTKIAQSVVGLTGFHPNALMYHGYYLNNVLECM